MIVCIGVIIARGEATCLDGVAVAFTASITTAARTIVNRVLLDTLHVVSIDFLSVGFWQGVDMTSVALDKIICC